MHARHNNTLSNMPQLPFVVDYACSKMHTQIFPLLTALATISKNLNLNLNNEMQEAYLPNIATPRGVTRLDSNIII